VVIKRGFDITFSIIGLIILAPFIPFVAWRIKKDSDGPALFKQERIGKNGQPFIILKFRTMYLDAEKDGPALSSSDDERITRFGRFLRKWRIDETPQFINVLKGEMTLIGPRPERQFYIEQLVKTEPAFNVLLKVKPGITSLGMVKFGYAENQEQMLKRLKYELLYMKNYSLRLDFLIFLYTLRTLVSAEGK
jgi:lipopolysaccharide/colanic/teichoic acid biosynthesis glycosyltransferase